MVCCTNINMIPHQHRKILEKKSLESYPAELMSCHFRHAGQASTCKGVSLRNRNELDRIHRNASPRLLGESTLSQRKQFFYLRGPGQRTADSTSCQHSQDVGNVMGCSWNMTPPIPLPKVATLQNSALSPGGAVSHQATEVLQQQHCRESEQQLLRKWPLIADKESMGFAKWMAPNHAFYLDF